MLLLGIRDLRAILVIFTINHCKSQYPLVTFFTGGIMEILIEVDEDLNPLMRTILLKAIQSNLCIKISPHQPDADCRYDKISICIDEREVENEMV